MVYFLQSCKLKKLVIVPVNTSFVKLHSESHDGQKIFGTVTVEIVGLIYSGESGNATGASTNFGPKPTQWKLHIVHTIIGINKSREYSKLEIQEAETGEKLPALEDNMPVKLEEDLEINMRQIQDL